jgi:glucose-6-phosphate isomerase, archaeal
MAVYYESPSKIEVNGRSVFVDGAPAPFTVRNFSEMRDVFMRQQVVNTDYPFYFMFREVAKKDGMRYDITILPAKVIEGEHAKTYGHYHPVAEPGMSYPEVYQVLDGRALFILQKRRNDGSVDTAVCFADKGSVMLIPPNWGHVTINADKVRTLVLANIVCDGFDSEYSDYKENRGAAYFATEFSLEPNANYIIRGTEKTTAEKFCAKYGFSCKDLYTEFNSNPEKFEFLKKPSLLFR